MFWAGFAVAAGGQVHLPYPDKAPSAVDIARQVYFVNHFQGVSNITYGSKKNGVVLINKPQGSRAKLYRLERHLNNSYDDGVIRARDLVVFRSGRLRGTGILVTDYLDAEKPLSFSVWLPELRKVRRHSKPHQADTWGGSVFTYGDVYLRRPSDETHEILDVASFPGCLQAMQSKELAQARLTNVLPQPRCTTEGRPVYRVKSVPVTPNWWYDYRIVWIDQHSFADYRSEYFKEGKLIKILDKDWQSMQLDDPRAQYWLYWYARDLRNQNQGMAYVPEEMITWNNPVEPGRWTLSGLRKIKR